MLPTSITNSVAVSSLAIVHISTAKPLDSTMLNLDALTSNKHVMVFSGFSGLGYSDLAGMKAELSSVLDRAIQEYGAHNLCVAAGATSVGIGMVYEIAKEKNIVTLGIVSEQAKGWASAFCDEVIYVHDPDSSWKVLDEAGNSYMVYVATQKNEISRTGEFLAFGGGAVTLSELQEAEKVGLSTTVRSGFEPSPKQVAKRREKDPLADLTPVRSAYQHHD